jgi:hypothetical protein
MVVHIIISIIAGAVGAEIFDRLKGLKRSQLKPVQEVVKKVGPSLYVRTKKRVPLYRSEAELWKKEKENQS